MTDDLLKKWQELLGAAEYSSRSPRDLYREVVWRMMHTPGYKTPKKNSLLNVPEGFVQTGDMVSIQSGEVIGTVFGIAAKDAQAVDLDDLCDKTFTIQVPGNPPLYPKKLLSDSIDRLNEKEYTKRIVDLEANIAMLKQNPFQDVTNDQLIEECRRRRLSVFSPTDKEPVFRNIELDEEE